MTGYRFGSYVFDARALTLVRDGERVALKPQPARFLKALLDAAPELVSRDELVAALWPDGRVVEFDQSLNSCALQARRALGENGTQFIETLARRGYRFVGSLESPAVSARPRRLHLAVGVLAIAMLVVSATSAVVWRRDNHASFTEAAAEPALNQTLIRARHGLRIGDIASLEDARARFAEAIAIAPQHEQARGGFALTTAFLAGTPGYPWRSGTREAERVAGDVLAGNPGQVEANLTLAYIRLYRDWSTAAAASAADRALASAPANEVALSIRASIAAAEGDARRAADLSDQAALADPVSMSVRSDRCWFHIFARAYADAVAACEWALEQDGEHQATLLGLAEALERQGRHADAHATLAAAADMEDDAMAAMAPGPDPSERLDRFKCRIAAQARDRAENNQGPAVLAGAFLVACGERGAALDLLRRAIAARESGMLFVAVDPRFDALRGDPEFTAAMADILSAGNDPAS